MYFSLIQKKVIFFLLRQSVFDAFIRFMIAKWYILTAFRHHDGGAMDMGLIMIFKIFIDSFVVIHSWFIQNLCKFAPISDLPLNPTL